MKWVMLWLWVIAGQFFCGAQIPVDKKESTNFMFYFLKAEDLFDERKYDDALINYNESLNLYPYYADAYYSRAVTKEKLNDPEGALRDYNIYLELNPEHFDALFSRALLQYSQKNWIPAKNDFLRLLTLPTGETSSIYFRQDRFTGDANQVFTSQGSNKAYIYNYVGLAHMELSDFNRASIYFDSAILFSPNEADYFANAGRCYEALGNFEEAKKTYQSALVIHPNHSVASHNYSILIRKDGYSQDSDKILDEIISKNPNLPYPYAERAFHNASKGEYQLALSDYNEAIRLAPMDAEYLVNRGEVKEKIKDWEGAYNDFTSAINLKENSEKAWFHRANLLYKKGLYQEAIKDYDITILLAGNYGMAFYNRALAKNKLGNNIEACKDLKEAQSLNFDVKPKVISKICGFQ